MGVPGQLVSWGSGPSFEVGLSRGTKCEWEPSSEITNLLKTGETGSESSRTKCQLDKIDSKTKCQLNPGNQKACHLSFNVQAAAAMWWTVHLEGGPRRVNHAAVAIGERVFSFGEIIFISSLLHHFKYYFC